VYISGSATLCGWFPPTHNLRINFNMLCRKSCENLYSEMNINLLGNFKSASKSAGKVGEKKRNKKKMESLN
jgi:hypothetical protein